ncbi:MAG: hypothetical protein KAX19_13375 [Candidatus Brocadiae bacterium]|nr:hypothetical protein [Candidatus Brocadiia bacterium]
MERFAYSLILISCFMHASWNLLARRRKRGALIFFHRMVTLAVPVSLVAMAIGLFFPHSFPPRAWLCVIASGAICGFYYWFLGLAYSESDFTIVYPVARALPVLAVALVADVSRGRYPSGVGWVGLLMVVGGCVLAPQVSYRNFDFKRYGTRDILWIVLTAATIVGFTTFDKIAAEVVKQGPASAAIYCSLFHIVSCISYVVIHAVFAKEKGKDEQVGWKWPAVGALLGYVTYTLVLWAYQLAPKASYLLAFRQFSIVIGVVLAFRVYRERGLAVRLPATLAIVAGMVLLVTYG